jgi:hypothetical protein
MQRHRHDTVQITTHITTQKNRLATAAMQRHRHDTVQITAHITTQKNRLATAAMQRHRHDTAQGARRLVAWHVSAYYV